METFALAQALGLDKISFDHVGVLLAREAAAAVLGAVLGYRIWRRLIPGALPPPRESAQAQTMIPVAGALMVLVIGDSMARAFGLVGLGAFIRFRSGIKDPRDATIMFVQIGVGMACGLGFVPTAVVATLFAAGVLIIFDLRRGAHLRPARLCISLADPRGSVDLVRSVFPTARVLELPNTNPEPGKLVLEVVLGESSDAATVLRMLEDRHVAGVRAVSVDDAKWG